MKGFILLLTVLGAQAAMAQNRAPTVWATPGTCFVSATSGSGQIVCIGRDGSAQETEAAFIRTEPEASPLTLTVSGASQAQDVYGDYSLSGEGSVLHVSVLPANNKSSLITPIQFQEEFRYGQEGRGGDEEGWRRHHRDEGRGGSYHHEHGGYFGESGRHGGYYPHPEIRCGYYPLPPCARHGGYHLNEDY